MLILKTVPGYPCTRTGKFGMFDKSCTRASLTLPKFAGPQRLTLGPRASMPLPGGLAQDGLPLHSACLDEHEVPKIAMAISGRARITARKEPARPAPLPPTSLLAARHRRRLRTDLCVRLRASFQQARRSCCTGGSRTMPLHSESTNLEAAAAPSISAALAAKDCTGSGGAPDGTSSAQREEPARNFRLLR